nr:hypothetical protein [Navicula tsukamotoi]UXN44531.1 hypothetical protein [Navicula tsukamotoi]
MKAFEKLVLDLNLIHIFITKLDYNYNNLDYKDTKLVNYLDGFSHEIAYFVLNLQDHNIIDKLNWDCYRSESPLFSVRSEDTTNLDMESSLDRLLHSTIICLELIELVNKVKDYSSFPIINDNLFQLENSIKYLIFQLKNSNHCSDKAKSNIIDLKIIIDLKKV